MYIYIYICFFGVGAVCFPRSSWAVCGLPVDHFQLSQGVTGPGVGFRRSSLKATPSRRRRGELPHEDGGATSEGFSEGEQLLRGQSLRS